MSKVKICGLSRPQDIEAINRALPDFVGFVFATSQRQVDKKTAIALRDKLDPSIQTVGVFVNEQIETVTELYRCGVIDIVQLHGDEDGEYIRRLKEGSGCRVIKLVGVGGTLPDLVGVGGTLLAPLGVGDKVPDLVDATGTPPAPLSVPDFLLFDTLSAQRGGTGKAFDWKLLLGYSGLPYFLAGGLSLETVSEAIRLLSPFCVDVSSGVETNGLKDAEKILKFVHLVREADS